MAAMRLGAPILLLMIVAACDHPGPNAPTATHQPTALPAPTPRPSPSFPPLFGPSRTFVFDRELSHPVQDYTKRSRFILYDNGAFVLQTSGAVQGGYRGGYREANGQVTFEWEGWSLAGAWGATGMLMGDSLTVHYNPIMILTDFEDAVYALVR
jgi:hypothetical protein